MAAGGGRGGSRVDLEGFGYAVDGDVNGVFVVGGEGAVSGGGGEEVADGEGETLLRGGLYTLAKAEIELTENITMVGGWLMMMVG